MAHASLASQTFILPKGKKSLGTCLFHFSSRNLKLFCHVNGMLICVVMFNERVPAGLVEVCFTNSGCCEAVSWQRVSSGYVYKQCFVLLDCRVRLKTDMEKAVFQVMVSLNIRKDSVAETLPPSHGNAEGSSNKQLELPGQHPSKTKLQLFPWLATTNHCHCHCSSSTQKSMDLHENKPTMSTIQ